MTIKEITVASWSLLAKLVESHLSEEWIFRGVSQRHYPLQPKIGRSDTRKHFLTVTFTMHRRGSAPSKYGASRRAMCKVQSGIRTAVVRDMTCAPVSAARNPRHSPSAAARSLPAPAPIAAGRLR